MKQKQPEAQIFFSFFFVECQIKREFSVLKIFRRRFHALPGSRPRAEEQRKAWKENQIRNDEMKRCDQFPTQWM